MSKPLIVVMSERARWTNDLPTLLGESYNVVTCRNLSELHQVAEHEHAAGAIADLSDMSGGGHQVEQQLESLRGALSDMPVAMLTPQECPEPLERRALYSGIMHLRGDVTVDNVLDWLQKTVPAEAADPSAGNLATSPPPEQQQKKREFGRSEPEAVLSGMTRRFETHTPELKRVLDDLSIAAEKDVTVLLIGETGSGKTYLSNLIHEVSPRRNEPFITVACGALPGDLLESELFGHVKGAFTSAHADKEGKFIAAKNGTILLDEIDVLGLEQQVKLLRVIETGQFEPVGSNQTLHSQARLVVASNLPLEPLVEQGKFRPDLYYRLSMLKFEIPPLRKRKPDIKGMAKRFIQAKSEKHGIAIHRIEQEVFDALVSYPWPGNVRELEYAIQRAVIYCRDGVLRAEHLPGHVTSGVAGPTNDPTVKLDSRKSVEDTLQLESQLATTEKDLIEQALIRNNYNRTKTAKELGVSRVTLYNKMKRYDIQ
ncbi:MAG: sigma-54 interaction domain-containing protein [Planctomycetota bacterium]|jgi:transcriptional regulator with PAS, ATPase and Fis domain